MAVIQFAFHASDMSEKMKISQMKQKLCMMTHIMSGFLKRAYKPGSYSGKKEEISFLPGLRQLWLTCCFPAPSNDDIKEKGLPV
jgi:hypothetical protein